MFHPRTGKVSSEYHHLSISSPPTTFAPATKTPSRTPLPPQTPHLAQIFQRARRRASQSPPKNRSPSRSWLGSTKTVPGAPASDNEAIPMRRLRVLETKASIRDWIIVRTKSAIARRYRHRQSASSSIRFDASGPSVSRRAPPHITSQGTSTEGARIPRPSSPPALRLVISGPREPINRSPRLPPSQHPRSPYSSNHQRLRDGEKVAPSSVVSAGAVPR